MLKRFSVWIGLLSLVLAFAQGTKLQLVEVITSPQRTQLLQGLIKDFESQNPGINVEIISLPWEQSFERLLTMVQGGQAPDVVEMPDKWLALYGATNQLENLKSYLGTWQYKNDLSARATEAGSLYQGQMLEIPYGFYIRGLFYNKKILADAGVKPPTTLAEFMKVAEAVTNKSKGVYGYCLRGARGSFDNIFWFMSNQAGTPNWFTPSGKSTFTDKAHVEGLSMWAQLYQKGWAPPDSVTWGFNEIVSGFYSGTCAMLDQDPDTLQPVQEKMSPDQFGVVPMPLGPSGKGFLKPGFAGWSMFKSSKNKEAAWKLIAYLASPSVNLKWSKYVGTIPSIQSSEKDPYYSSPTFKAWFDELRSPKYTLSFFPFQIPELGNFLDVYSVQETQKLLLGQQTAEVTAQHLADYMEKAYAKWKASNK
ncbi:ABC transporter substrate-binding protein [Meiothermus granaticius]|uniref:Multiple sugar-binding protein n=1 Tax=Meiothermus granaticius NBRC 107808 TaxID=1227551 RepID=A0A399F6N7_9DEIN|nr:sugar ABC transporter substrate-binding protein [Meiothermus granaticius]RIH91898.1 Multiple sugar-binding protein [Meiothermus granaticius NBRC 107808]GEM85482.1 ABC transporter substrate-binding protein [Meiothermus granaticius NBRC 107808]